MFVNNITSDVLIIRYFLSSLIFSVCSFQGTLLTDFSSVIRNLNFFKSLITGETSYQNSTSLLMGLASISCCSSLPVSMPKDFAPSFRALVGWYFRILGKVFSSLRFLKFPYPKLRLFSFLNLAATYSPTPSPVQYHRPSGS